MDTLREAAKKEIPDGELRIVSGETCASYRMPQVLQRFRQRAPKVRLSLQSLNCYVIRDALLNDEADVGVFYRVGNDDALTDESWVNNRWCWWLHRKLQMSILLSREDITPVALLSTNRNVYSGRYLRQRCASRRITVENTIELLSIESIKRCVAANIGVSSTPALRWKKSLRAEN
ncbi:substrate-binding domain-containing protein [Escherichia coli]